MNKPPQAETATARVKGRTLQEAKENVRRRYGRDALIVGSRQVRTASRKGLGVNESFEIEVALPDGRTAAKTRPGRMNLSGLSDALEAEVARAEAMVETLKSQRSRHSGDPAGEASLKGYPLARDLLAGGASMPAVRHLAHLCGAGNESGTSPIEHFLSVLRCSGGDLADMAGCHVFLGESGAGKTDLILGLAARLVGMKKRVLALGLHPRHKGEVRRLQEEAAGRGYDAAVLRDGRQLMSGLELIDAYDVVLIDTPAISAPGLLGDKLRERLAGENRMHRHLVVAADHDLRDNERLWAQARDWNCDWLALTRLDLVRMPGKLLDLLLCSPLGVSLHAAGYWPDREIDVATPEWLAGTILSRSKPREQTGRRKAATH